MTVIDTTGIVLDSGGHSSPDDGMCLLEAVAYVTHGAWTDHPTCVCEVLGTFGRRLNDVLPDDKRQQLVAFIPRMVGTAGDGLAQERAYMALDWLIRTYTPTWLDLAGLSEQAQTLRDLRRIVDLAAAKDAGPKVRAAGDAAWAAARAAAGDAAWAAAWDAAGAAAGAAAWDAAGDAAQAAAGAAAGAALKPTVDELQQSAIDLFDRMIGSRVAVPLL